MSVQCFDHIQDYHSEYDCNRTRATLGFCLLEMNTDVQMVGYFSGTDRRSEYFDSHLLLQGGNGLLSRDGIMKPAGFAMQLWNGLADHQIALEDNFIVTTNRRNSYYIAAYNKRPLSLYYYKTPENAVEKEKLLKYYEDEVIPEQNLELHSCGDPVLYRSSCRAHFPEDERSGRK